MTLETITSKLLAPVRHGFFTRKGGASSGVFSGLNCGLGSSDQADIVKINRARVAHAMGAEPDALIGVHQIHSADVSTVSAQHPNPTEPSDGVVTADSGLVLAILTADCAPVLFADPVNGVIGAAHAGWQGALSGVLEATIDAMTALGAQREDIRAAIGPTISQSAYEVGPEFFERFMDEEPENSRFFAGGRGDRMQFDLPAFALHRMRRAGVENAEWLRHCTYSDPARFYSFRRSVHKKSADYGRLISTIRL